MTNNDQIMFRNKEKSEIFNMRKDNSHITDTTTIERVYIDDSKL